MNNLPLVLFDGPCSLCQRSIRFILRHEREPTLRFASLQSETGKKALEDYQIPPETDAMVLIEDNKALSGSEAALTLCKFLNYPWRLFYSLRQLPSFLHQPLYAWVARHRYRWFGKDETCPLPDPEQAERFLN
jgi:predicted DCC family thiol-disulfide oxidoreductase YuxK